MKLLTIIYKSGVVVEMTCTSYRANHYRGTLVLDDPDPQPIGGVLDTNDIAEIYEGKIYGAHDNILSA